MFCSSFVLDRDTCSLHSTIEEYVDGARICLELESEKDSLREIKLYFCRFVRKMIKSFERKDKIRHCYSLTTVCNELKLCLKNLFYFKNSHFNH